MIAQPDRSTAGDQYSTEKLSKVGPSSTWCESRVRGMRSREPGAERLANYREALRKLSWSEFQAHRKKGKPE